MNLAQLRVRLATGLALAAVALSVAGCGDDSGSEDASVQEQIEQAREEGAEAARRQQRLQQLEQKVRRLERQNDGDRAQADSNSGQPVAAAPNTGSPAAATVLRVFHAPSGNVSCEIRSDGAACAVDSLGETFAFSAGEAAQIEPGTTLSADSGELAPYGSAVSAGSITCSVPLAGEPRGVVCADSNSGHGFEASRIPSRQRTY